MEQGQPPIFIVLNAAPEEIGFKLPEMPEYKSWQQVLNTVEAVQTSTEFVSGVETSAPPRSVLAFAGTA
jgi:glycogen operon protein